MAEPAAPSDAGAKRLDYWWTVLAVDPLAIPLVRLLARRRWLTPDQASLLSLGLGLAVGPAYYVDERIGLVVGGLLFYASFVFDCVDGKLARVLGTSSPRGRALDQLADGARRASASLGLAAYLWRHEDSGAVLAAAVYAVLSFYFMEISGTERAEIRRDLAGRWAGALAKHRLLPNPGMPEASAVTFVLGPITGLVLPALIVGTAMMTLAVLVAVARRLRGGNE